MILRRKTMTSRSLSAAFLGILLSASGPVWGQGMQRGQDPHAAGFAGGGAAQDFSTPDPAIPAGKVVVEVMDSTGKPVPGVRIELHSRFQSVAQGNSDDVAKATSGADGRATFTDLDATIRYSYGVSVFQNGATYEIPPFQLTKVGQLVRMHTYPVTSDPKEAFVGLQGYVSVQVKEDLFRIDAVYRVVNMGGSTWVPQSTFLRLPEDAQAIEATLTTGDSGFKETNGRLALVGSFPPGQKDIPFSFHVPNTNQETRSISLGLPPHVVDLNVLTAQAPGLELSVSPGFNLAEERTGRDGKTVLVTRRVMKPGEGQLRELVIELRGLPVIGPGRWIAVALALALSLLGVFATTLLRSSHSQKEAAQKENARTILLDEMVRLEAAHQKGDIGPRTYEQTKREILGAIARLEPLSSTS